ncbi:MAG: hypothetical protein KatS3mg031_1121 [Chitinophagales bacterium]|nr:MAG: hypothetical protein KatS3mg031_1121 [Chitinophagales bacterium]
MSIIFSPVSLFLCFFTMLVCLSAEAVMDEVCRDSLQSHAQWEITGNDNTIHSEEELIYPRQLTSPSPWLFVLFLVQLALIAVLRVFYTRDFEELFRSLANANVSHQLYRQEGKNMSVPAILLNINFVLSGGIYLHEVVREEVFMQESYLLNLLFSIWLVIVLYSARYAFLKFISWVFPFGKELDQYNFNFYLHLKAAGVFLVPLNLIIVYFPYKVFPVSMLSGLILIVAVLLAYGRGWNIASDIIRRNKFHFIIYLCTLEVAPVSILLKAVFEWVN